MLLGRGAGTRRNPTIIPGFAIGGLPRQPTYHPFLPVTPTSRVDQSPGTAEGNNFTGSSREISTDSAKQFFLGLRGAVYNGSDCEALLHWKWRSSVCLCRCRSWIQSCSFSHVYIQRSARPIWEGIQLFYHLLLICASRNWRQSYLPTSLSLTFMFTVFYNNIYRLSFRPPGASSHVSIAPKSVLQVLFIRSITSKIPIQNHIRFSSCSARVIPKLSVTKKLTSSPRKVQKTCQFRKCPTPLLQTAALTTAWVLFSLSLYARTANSKNRQIQQMYW